MSKVTERVGVFEVEDKRFCHACFTVGEDGEEYDVMYIGAGFGAVIMNPAQMRKLARWMTKAANTIDKRRLRCAMKQTKKAERSRST